MSPLAKLLGDAVRNTAGSAAKKTATKATSGIAREGVKEALGAMRGAATQAAKPSKVASILRKSEKIGINSPMNLTRAEMRKIGDNAPDALTNLTRRTGISDMDVLSGIAPRLTGGENSLMDDITRYAVTNGGKGNKVIGSELAGLIDSKVNAISPTYNMDKLKFGNNLKNAVTSGDPYSRSNELIGQAAEMLKKPTVTELDKVQAKIYREVGNELKEKVYANVTPKNVKNAFQNYQESLLDMAEQATKAGNKAESKAFSNLAKEAQGIPTAERTVDRFRTLKRDWVDLDKIAKANKNATGGSAWTRTATKIPIVGELAAPILDAPVTAAAQAIGRGSGKLAEKFESGQAQRALKGAALAGGGLLALNAMGGNDQQPAMPQPTTLEGVMGASPMTQQQAPTERDIALQVYNELGLNGNAGYGVATVGGYSTDQIEEAYTKALVAGDTKAASAIKGMLDIAYDKEDAAREEIAATIKASKTTTSNAKAPTTAQIRAMGAQNSLDRLEQLGDGGVAYKASKIPVVGNLVDLMGGNQYGAAADGLALQIGFMLSGANVAPREAEAIGRSYVPQPWDSETVKQQKIMMANQIINGSLAGYTPTTQ